MIHSRSTPWLALMCALFIVTFSLASSAGPVTGLTSFQPGDVADANDVNANFARLANELNDNDSRLGLIEASAARRSVHFPARSLAYGATDTGVTPDGLGLIVSSSANSLRVLLRRPADYAGGDASVTIVFAPLISISGVVDFEVQHSGNDCNGTRFQHVTLNAAGVVVSDNERLHCQTFTVAAAALDYDVWSAVFQRAGSDSTYTDDLRVLSVDWEYSALPASP